MSRTHSVLPGWSTNNAGVRLAMLAERSKSGHMIVVSIAFGRIRHGTTTFGISSTGSPDLRATP